MLKILPIRKIYQLRNTCSNTGILTPRKYSQTRNTTNAEMFPAFKITNNEVLQHRNITNIETLPKAKNCQHRNITNMETLPKAKITNIEISLPKANIISSEASPSTKCHQPRNITWIWQPFSKSTFPTVNLKNRSIAKYKKNLVFICRVNSKINI